MKVTQKKPASNSEYRRDSSCNVTEIISYPERKVPDTIAAHVLGVTHKTLKKWRWERKGPKYYKIGSACVYRVGDLLDFLAERAA